MNLKKKRKNVKFDHHKNVALKKTNHHQYIRSKGKDFSKMASGVGKNAPLKNGRLSPTSNKLNYYQVPVGEVGENISFTLSEVENFDMIFRIVDSNEDGIVEGAVGASFLRRSNLSDQVLRDVWRLACGGNSKPSMTRDLWFIALKLVALAQTIDPEPPTVEPLINNRILPLPFFGFKKCRIVETIRGPIIPEEAITIKLSNPITRGAGVMKYTVYDTKTETTLSHFVYKEMRVNRRYSDFLWLHKCLSCKYLGVVIPPMPDKKLFGNFNELFVEERRQALELFVNRVSHHSLLSKSLELEIFLSSSRKGMDDAQFLSDDPDNAWYNKGYVKVKNWFNVFGKKDGANKDGVRFFHRFFFS